MINKKKFLLTSMAITSLLVGCEKSSKPEIIEEYTTTEENEIENKEMLETENDIQKDEKNEKENKKEDENIINNTTDNKDDAVIKDVSSNNKQENSTTDKDKYEANKTESNPNKTESNSNKAETSQTTSQNKEESTTENDITLVSNPVFTKSEITESLKARMSGKSMKENESISFDDLSYLTITYLDYNGKTQQGEMVVHRKLADEVLEIFRDIYYAKFPIEKMSLIDDYNAVDHTSMVNNNSSAFCYRTIAGTNKVSNHGMGMAIDINPFYNPHVLKSSGTVNPVEASKYANRSLNAKGMIKANDAVYKAFTSRGWTWGGHWKNPDYQHFEKKV